MKNLKNLNTDEKVCRGCKSINLFVGIDLGQLPIANELLQASTEGVDEFPLKLMVCADCGLGQVDEVTSTERIFSDYRYLSSTSTLFSRHAKEFAQREMPSLEKSDWVLEIASNDGYLLQYFLEYGARVLGVEPAANVANLALSKGIPTINEFFTSRLAKQIFEEFGHPKLIVANNVLAHVPDIIDFLNGLSILCGVNTKISIENPSLSNILIGKQFDTIYHEHYSYLTGTSVSVFANQVGLQLFSAENLSTHGGSIRYWLRSANNQEIIHKSVNALIKLEEKQALFDPNSWTSFAVEIHHRLQGFRNWVASSKEKGGTICGFGAAAKASTVINSSNLQKDDISAIADSGSEKQGRFMPRYNIPIIKPAQLSSYEPTDIIIFPWNIADEIETSIHEIFHRPPRIWKSLPQQF